ncbi:SIR2 family NAD-dependent protein deacylase [Chryseobacterium candidae]|uniref:protein acetyllysine N-acetyltransferase n=1 Tax=Chryseobacterium candidae TaxID=1978493 RepID=A0ABY2R8S6_9FLAO|nr:Sir2 family NAD-dependent protein deacetylase [Chryseobacterium candidae]THV61906.1 iron dicitrate transport regulator FecR [Chryseobacterium candidae]
MKLIVETLIQETLQKEKKNLFSFLTGAGISSESGLPTYRGNDGIWIKGTKYHQPEEFGTFRYFSQNQEEVWQYNLFWKKLIEEAQPNTGHFAIAEIEKILKNQFQLITQNVDGLHHRAGSQKIFEIHGNKQSVRCSSGCNGVLPMPSELKSKELTEDLTEKDLDLLRCQDCGDWLRPNTLWFDESYNEKLYFLNSTLRAAKKTGILFIIGTSGATTLPQIIAEKVLQYGGYLVEINTEENSYFFERFSRTKKYMLIREKASDGLIKIKEMIEKYT